MIYRFLFLAALFLTFGAVSFASAPTQTFGYIGEWSNGRAFELKFTVDEIEFTGKAPSQPIKFRYRDLTKVSDGNFYQLEILNPPKQSYITRFVTVSIQEGSKPLEMALTFYNSAAEMTASENPAGNDTYFRDGESADEPEIPIVGGFKQISKTDETVVAAANFAVSAQAKKFAALKLVAIERADKQIVAGANYKLCLAVNSGGQPQQATALVYHNLQNKFLLTSWTSGKCATAAKSGAPTAAALAPDTVVKNLYAAQKNDKNAPFYQNNNRAAVDLFFTKDFADLIWTEAVAADGVGVLGADPLYNAQDTEITAFKIGAPEYGDQSAGTEDTATVKVSFRNFRQPETIRFILEKNVAKQWRISDIRYQSGDMLKGMYFAAQRDQANQPAQGEFEGDFKVGTATCAVKPIKMAFEVRCSNWKAAQIFFFDADSDTAQPVFKTDDAKRKFAFDDDTYTTGTFTDATGKTANISRVQ